MKLFSLYRKNKEELLFIAAAYLYYLDSVSLKNKTEVLRTITKQRSSNAIRMQSTLRETYWVKHPSRRHVDHLRLQIIKFNSHIAPAHRKPRQLKHLIFSSIAFILYFILFYYLFSLLYFVKFPFKHYAPKAAYQKRAQDT